MRNLKRKVLGVLMIAAMLAVMFCGCVSVDGEVLVNPDESGSITIEVGFSEKCINMLNMVSEANGGEPVSITTEGEELVEFEHDGVTYYGDKQTMEFTSFEELNELLKNETGVVDGAGAGDNDELEHATSGLAADMRDMTGVQTGSWVFNRNEAGDISLCIEGVDMYSVMESEFDIDANYTDDMAEAVGVSADELEAAMQEMRFTISVLFPWNVAQTAGDTLGVAIEGNRLTLDLVAMAQSDTKTSTYEFVAICLGDGWCEPGEPKQTDKFYDVVHGSWYEKAVYTIRDYGLVQGVGNGMFAPEKTLSWGEYCTILCRDLDLEEGEVNGYWAGKAVQHCLDMGIIMPQGEVSEAVYGAPIPREAAIAGFIWMHGGTEDTENDFTHGRLQYETMTVEDIPDASEISGRYVDAVVAAYNYDITHGVDADGNFNPHGSLTRAEICQLLCNVMLAVRND